MKEVFSPIAKEYGFVIVNMEVVGGLKHMFTEAPLIYSRGEVVQIVKSISGGEVFKKFPEMGKRLLTGCNGGYLVRSIGDEVNFDIITNCIKYQSHEAHPLQLIMFNNP